MKTALVCIAKNEDPYIDEWIKYHTKLGFDFIYVYQNNWRYRGDKTQYVNVHWIEFDGQAKQIECYQNFIKFHNDEYDWAAFFDVDEYLVLLYKNDLKYWLSDFNDFYAIGVNWKMFGDNGISEVTTYQLINRFTKASNNLNKHIKTILNVTKCRQNNIIYSLVFSDPHSLEQSHHMAFTVSTNKKDFINGPYNVNTNNQTAQLNHYYCKTLSEFINIKCNRGFADQVGNSYKLASFYENNCNDKEDLSAKKFWNSL